MHPFVIVIATFALLGMLLAVEAGYYIVGGGLALVTLYAAYQVDKAQKHENLGLGSEALLYENGAVDTECPACEATVSIYPNKDFPNPSGGTMCAECGSSVASDGRNVKLMHRNNEYFNA